MKELRRFLSQFHKILNYIDRFKKILYKLN